MKRTSILLGAILTACGGPSSPAPPEDLVAAAAADLAAPRADLAAPPDLAAPAPDLSEPPAPDLAAPPDLAKPADLVGPNPGKGCQSDKDCRLFRNMCAKPGPACTCIPLLAWEPDPVCGGPQVLCKVDPCANKVAVCELATGNCLVK